MPGSRPERRTRPDRRATPGLRIRREPSLGGVDLSDLLRETARWLADFGGRWCEAAHEVQILDMYYRLGSADGGRERVTLIGRTPLVPLGSEPATLPWALLALNHQAHLRSGECFALSPQRHIELLVPVRPDQLHPAALADLLRTAHMNAERLLSEWLPLVRMG